MSNDAVAMKKRRRSSVFGETRSIKINDVAEDDKKSEDNNGELKSEQARKIEESIKTLKKCKMQWLTYASKLKKEWKDCKASRCPNVYQNVSENFIDYLNASDREFLLSLNSPKNYPTKNDVDSLLKRLQLAEYRREYLADQYDLLCTNVKGAYSAAESRLIPALSAEPKFLQELDEFVLELAASPASNSAPCILDDKMCRPE